MDIEVVLCFTVTMIETTKIDWTDREQFNAYQREMGRRRRAGVFSANTKARKMKALLDFLAEQKARPCMDCGVQYSPWVMDFHHENPEEKAIAVSKCKTLAKAKAEIEKCVLLCANCHRQRHYEERQSELLIILSPDIVK